MKEVVHIPHGFKLPSEQIRGGQVVLWGRGDTPMSAGASVA